MSNKLNKIENTTPIVKEDGGATPKEIKRARKTTKRRNPKGAGRRRDWNHTFHIKQKDLEGIPIYCPLSIKQEKFLNDEEHDIIVWGGAAGAGKTQLSLLKIMTQAFFDGEYTAGIARRSQRQMKQAGSLWSTGNKMFTRWGATSNRIELQWTFPSGAEVRCHHLSGNPDDWQGSQLAKVLVDEAQQCTEDDVWYLTSRMRTSSKIKPQMFLTCNPLDTSFLCRWLVKGKYIDDKGFPIPERDGATTYMAQVGGEFTWFETRKEIEELHGAEMAKYALSFTYYSANVYDNPYIRRYQPDYVNKLENLKQVDKDRLLLGNWFAKEEGSGFVTKEQFNQTPLSEVPLNLPKVRAWDLAGTKPHSANRDPDFTRGILGAYSKETGDFYVLAMESLRDNHAMVQAAIERCVLDDGKETYVTLPIDSGASGRSVADQKKARLMQMGAKVVLEPTRQSKLVRAEPLLIAIQEGKVHVAPNVFTDANYLEIESFDGQRSGGQHDDIIDAMATCYNTLVTGNLIPTIRMNRNTILKSNLGGRTLL